MRVPEACVIVVGDELVTGRRYDRNGVRIGRWLEGLGCIVRTRSLVPDDEGTVADAVRAALATGAEFVIVTGGIGPTADDRTREGIAAGLGAPLELDAAALATIEKRYLERGREIPGEARRQAMRPQQSESIPNPVGIAPGFLVDRGRSLLVALPGVTREADEMLARSVLPRFRTRLAGALSVRSTVLHVAGLAESEVDRRIKGAVPHEGGAQITLIETHGEVEVLATVRAEGGEEADEMLARTLAAIEAPLGDHIYGRDDDTLVGALRDVLQQRGWTLGVAESITGGLLAKTIVDLPGAGRFFVGSLIPYADARKSEVLGIPPGLLERCGPVSGEVARAMAEGARARLGSDVAIAATGIAGPGGGTHDKPVGLAYLAVAWPDRTMVRRHMFSGERGTIRSLATTMALDQARRALMGLPPLGDPAESAEGA